MGKNPFATYQTSGDLESRGVLIQEPNFQIRIARAGGKNTKYRVVAERVLRPVRRALQLGVISEEVAAEKTADILAEAIILDWKTRDLNGPEDLDEAIWIDGVPDPTTFEIVPATVQNIKAALLAAPELAQYLMDQAKDASVFREDIEADAKN